MSIYNNIFHYYRGQTRNKDEETNQLQIENNVTKAFLNVLQHASPVLASEFIRFIGIEIKEIDNFEFRQQLTSQLNTITPIAVVVGIAENKEIKNGTYKDSNIPDGAILSDEISLLLENKIGYNSYLNKEQLEGHRRLFANGQNILDEPIIMTWIEIRQFFRAKQKDFEKEGDVLSSFLLKQFEEFCVINCIGDRQKSKEYFFLRFEKDKARKLAREIDSFIWNNAKFEVEDAGTADGIGYRRKGFPKFATLTTARQRCLILHVGNKDEMKGLEIQTKIDKILKRDYNRSSSDTIKYPHEAYIRLEWVEDFEQVKPYIIEAYSSR
ncbi:hypothetical protein [Bacillus sp. AG4(2022)]|uniref:hypothetical protein n=1 Tax=Bacillus sp. AG4(2022) TaxID=2962594 RepID=UPI002881FDF4|nr:hypothetical protein [Bacillus sp. AG4(2022)]MDT0163523.1 hypothetical protein [Bacillus sp. AG4(2022)]